MYNNNNNKKIIIMAKLRLNEVGIYEIYVDKKIVCETSDEEYAQKVVNYLNDKKTEDES